MESVLFDFAVLGVMFCPILIAAYVISKNDPRSNWDEEDLMYGMGPDKELPADIELEAEKKRREKIKNWGILILELTLFVIALTLAKS